MGTGRRMGQDAASPRASLPTCLGVGRLESCQTLPVPRVSSCRGPEPALSLIASWASQSNLTLGVCESDVTRPWNLPASPARVHRELSAGRGPSSSRWPVPPLSVSGLPTPATPQSFHLRAPALPCLPLGSGLRSRPFRVFCSVR